MSELIKIFSPESKNHFRIEYMIGNYCNYKCWYCGDYANGGSHRWFSNFDKLIKNFSHLLDFYKSKGKNKFEVNLLGGEPTLWPEITNFATFIKSNYDAEITLTTNGSRTLRWWDQNADAFDRIYFSYHHKEADLEHFINVLDLVYEKRKALYALAMMDPTAWNECVQAIETMKLSSNPWYINAMEIHPSNYSEEQKKFFLCNIKRRPPILRRIKNEYKNIIKGKTKVLYSNGKFEKIERNFLSLNKLNSFKGWNCNLGLESINIQKDGKITGTCNNLLFNENKFYNLYDDDFIESFNPILQSTICTKSGCWCQPEMFITKWKT